MTSTDGSAGLRLVNQSDLERAAKNGGTTTRQWPAAPAFRSAGKAGTSA